MSKNYFNRGVSSQKEDVHKATSKLYKGISPYAFCQVFEDDKEKKYISLHADGAGTKSSLAYIYWKETGDVSVFEGIAQDALIMNIDDLLCVGGIVNKASTYVSSTIGRNKHRIPGEILQAIINGTNQFINKLNSHGANIQFSGGETADVGDLVRTIIVDNTVYTSLDKKQFIDAKNIKPNLAIVGLSSFGKANYENEYNSGIGSNGLTSARHDLLSKNYRSKYPESYDDMTDINYIYNGHYLLTDRLPFNNNDFLCIGKLLLSPCRTYFPVINEILTQTKIPIHGIIHCSGGGQTKCKKFSKNIHYIKDNLFELPPLFELLRNVKNTTLKEFFQTYNAGHRMEIYAEHRYVNEIIDISHSFGVEAKQIGHTEFSFQPENEVTIKLNLRPSLLKKTINYS